jgi:hypothetical protein
MHDEMIAPEQIFYPFFLSHCLYHKFYHPALPQLDSGEADAAKGR